jgi:hypothetical protein
VERGHARDVEIVAKENRNVVCSRLVYLRCLVYLLLPVGALITHLLGSENPWSCPESGGDRSVGNG